MKEEIEPCHIEVDFCSFDPELMHVELVPDRSYSWVLRDFQKYDAINNPNNEATEINDLTRNCGALWRQWSCWVARRGCFGMVGRDGHGISMCFHMENGANLSSPNAFVFSLFAEDILLDMSYSTN